MATGSKKSGAPGKQSRKTTVEATDYEQYVQLRTILDSLEIGALRFYLNDTNAAEKKKRFEKLEDELMPIINQVWGGGAKLITCPRGYTNCEGTCVPYSCP